MRFQMKHIQTAILTVEQGLLVSVAAELEHLHK
jgi:hypothetical protein